jgi:hypothetical protein
MRVPRRGGGLPVTINIAFTGGSPVSGTFTASGAFCASGTSTESGPNFRLTTLTCADGTGSIAVHFAQYGNDGKPATWSVRKGDGTGAYAGVSGGGAVTLDTCGTFPCEVDLTGTLG